ncbi:hypothetical protein SAMN04488056_111127 [Cohaesibacter marisflavi]|uniref:Uncharacterized protein n=2 Tax=Cohaesibacter marisflavi TaxID=655353 RepID=A0A1I5JFE3_9HYPH|nr:hypothetical protein SAMN04488056_111127 [Cohaesibacter marisflavi]
MERAPIPPLHTAYYLENQAKSRLKKRMTEREPKSRQQRQDEKARQAERALERVDAEGEALGTSAFARTANRAKDHLGANDADPNDPIEIWGTRIGRIGGVIFAIFLVLWLVNHFTR